MDELIAILHSINEDVDWENSNALVTNGEIDSLDVVEIISAIEDHYYIHLSGDDIDIINFESVKHIMDMIIKYVQ